MLYIDGKPVPSDPETGQALANIQLVNGQWVLASNIGKDVMPEFRAIPEKLLRDAIFFEDKTSKKKIGYIDANRLAKYYSDYKVPQGAGYDQFKKDLSKAALDIKQGFELSVKTTPSGILPLVALGLETTKQLGEVAGSVPSGPSRYTPITSDGNIKRPEVLPNKSTPDATLTGTPIQPPSTMDAKDAITSRWAALKNLSFDSTTQTWTGPDGLPGYILSQKTKTGPKIVTLSETQFNQILSGLSNTEIKQYQQSLKNAGLWNNEVNGELNYLTRETFNQAIRTAADAATAENLQAYRTNGATKSILDVINQAAKTGAGSKTSAETYIINRESAQSTLDDIYLNSIGRKANKKEVDEFYRKVQKEAKARPTVRTDTGSAATTRQGFSGETLTEMASAQAEARPEFLAYQLSTNFYNALLGASRLPLKFGAGEAPATGPLG